MQIYTMNIYTQYHVNTHLEMIWTSLDNGHEPASSRPHCMLQGCTVFYRTWLHAIDWLQAKEPGCTLSSLAAHYPAWLHTRPCLHWRGKLGDVCAAEFAAAAVTPQARLIAVMLLHCTRIQYARELRCCTVHVSSTHASYCRCGTFNPRSHFTALLQSHHSLHGDPTLLHSQSQQMPRSAALL